MRANCKDVKHTGSGFGISQEFLCCSLPEASVLCWDVSLGGAFNKLFDFPVKKVATGLTGTSSFALYPCYVLFAAFPELTLLCRWGMSLGGFFCPSDLWLIHKSFRKQAKHKGLLSLIHAWLWIEERYVSGLIHLTGFHFLHPLNSGEFNGTEGVSIYLLPEGRIICKQPSGTARAGKGCCTLEWFLPFFWDVWKPFSTQDGGQDQGHQAGGTHCTASGCTGTKGCRAAMLMFRFHPVGSKTRVGSSAEACPASLSVTLWDVCSGRNH